MTSHWHFPLLFAISKEKLSKINFECFCPAWQRAIGRLERYVERKTTRGFLDWKNSFLLLQVALPYWFKRFPEQSSTLLCMFLFPSLGGSPITVWDGETAKGAELSRTVQNKKERKTERGNPSLSYLLLFTSFHCQLEICRHCIVRILMSYKRMVLSTSCLEPMLHNAVHTSI